MMDETLGIEIVSRIFDDEEILSVQSADFENSRGEKKESPDSPQHEDERKTLASRSQGYCFKLLLFAFLSEAEEKTLSDIIEHIETDADGKRIGKHLQIDVFDLRLFHEKCIRQSFPALRTKSTTYISSERKSRRTPSALRCGSCRGFLFRKSLRRLPSQGNWWKAFRLKPLRTAAFLTSPQRPANLPASSCKNTETA